MMSARNKAASACAFLSLLLVFPPVAEAQVIGIDFGSEFIKVAGVKPTTGIDIVLNEQSKRKSNNFIGYRGEERFVGEDAFNLAPRFPTRMFTFLNRIAGHSKDSPTVKTFKEDFWLPYEFGSDPARGDAVTLTHPDFPEAFNVETLLSQLLNYVKIQAEKHLEVEISQAVISVPFFLTPPQREAFVQAGNLTGLKIAGLQSGSSAAALQYGIQNRGFGNSTLTVAIYDMGASHSEVGLFRFSPPVLLENGVAARGGELGHLSILSIKADETLGGRAIDVRIAQFLGREFEKKTGLQFLGKKSEGALKAYTVLVRAAKKAKEVLSANKDAIVAIEELYEGTPFMYTITREQMIEECSELFNRAGPLILDALKEAQLDLSELDQVEVIGGAIRIPSLQDSISEALGGKPLGKTMNGDESIALGAAFYGAKVSGTFRTKGFSIDEKSPYNITFKLSKNEETGQEPMYRDLFIEPASGSKKAVTVTRTSEFDVNLYWKQGEVQTPYKTFHIKDVASTLDKVGFNNPEKNVSNSHSVQLQIKFGHDGLVDITSATVKYDEHNTTLRKVKVKDETAKNEEKKEEDEKEQSKQEGNNEDEKKDEGKPEAEKESTDEAKYEWKNKTSIKKHRKPITWSESFMGCLPLNDLEVNKSLEVLKKIQGFEDLKRDAAAAKNDLESYIYWIKWEGVLDNEAVQPFITPEEKTALSEALEEVGDWVEYGEGSEESTKTAAFKEKHGQLKKIVDQILDKKKAKEEAEKKELEEKAKAEAKLREEEEAAKKSAEEPSDVKGSSQEKDEL